MARIDRRPKGWRGKSTVRARPLGNWNKEFTWWWLHRRKQKDRRMYNPEELVYSFRPNRIHFLWQGDSAGYNALTPDAETAYFLLDTQQIFIGNVEFASSASQRQGYYDQVNDQIAGGGALDAATNYNNGDFYELLVSGAFTTPLPELNGLNGNVGDKIIAFGGTWLHQALGSSYLSSNVDDTAKGVITFNEPPRGLKPAAVKEDFERQEQVDSKDAATLVSANNYTDAHAAITTTNDDAHGSQTYTDNELNAHKGESAVDAEVHGVRQYVASVTDPIDQDLQSHKADTDIHWADVPNDGTAYVRRNKAWAPGTNMAVLVGPPGNASLGTGGFRLTGWAANQSVGLMAGREDPIGGGITIPEDGYYTVNTGVFGQQGNDNKEESIWLELETVGGLNPGIQAIAHESVDTDKTSDRSLGGSVTRYAYANSTIYLRMRASTGLGTFNFEVATFEIEKKI